MKNNILQLLSIPLLVTGAMPADAFENEIICANVGEVLNRDTNRYDVANGGLGDWDILRTKGPIYLPLGQTTRISANTSAFYDQNRGPGKSEYAWYETDNSFSIPRYKKGFDSSSNFDYKPENPGRSWVALVMINSNFTLNLAGMWDDFLPVCETVEIITHAAPSMTPRVYVEGGHTIRGTVNAKIDPFSKRGREGKGPLVTWHVQGVQRPDIQYSHVGPSLSYASGFYGYYNVTVTVSDGVFSNTRRFTELNVREGITPCQPGVGCLEIP